MQPTAELLTAPSLNEAAHALIQGAADLLVADAREQAWPVLEVLRAARAGGSSTPFVLIAPGPGHPESESVRFAARELGPGVILPGNRLDPERLARAAARALSVGQARAELQAPDRQVELRAEIERLQAANRELEQFAFAAAHDLDEPLRTIELSLATARAGIPESVESARAAAGRLRALLRALLECAQVTQSESPLEPIDLSAPLDWALQNLERSLRESGGRVTRGSLPVVRCDPVQIARALQNLIGNALRYRAAEAPRVHVATRRRGEHLILSVSDNGIGIAVEQRERIFRPFVRGPGAPTGEGGEGSGLGLALCQRIAERHGGRIWVESEPGKGASFFLSLRSA